MTYLAISHTGTVAGDPTETSRDLQIERGQHVVIVGGTGSGKTALANLLAGLEQTETWDCRLNGAGPFDLTGRERAQLVGIVPSDPALVFSHLGQTIRREIELSSELLGEASENDATDQWIQRLRLYHLADRDPLTLSGGEKARAAIALVLAKNPAILVVDDIHRELDSSAERICLEVLSEERARRGMVLVELSSMAPRSDLRPGAQWAFIGSDGLVAGSLASVWRAVHPADRVLLPTPARIALELESRFHITFERPPESARELARQLDIEPRKVTAALAGRGAPPQPGSPAIEAKALVFSYAAGGFTLGPLDFHAPSGTVTALVGPNGAGKTTLLRCLASLNRDWQGSVDAAGHTLKSATALHDWARSVTYCFQNPDDQLYLPTVRRELEESLQRLGTVGGDNERRLEDVAGALGLTDFLDTSPFDLPRPLRRLVTLASGFVAQPPVLLLDEPTVALDGSQVIRLTSVLRGYVSAGGTAILISHDHDFVAEVADSVVFLDSGKITHSIRRDSRPSKAWGADTISFTAQLLGEIGCDSSPLVRVDEMMQALGAAGVQGRDSVSG